MRAYSVDLREKVLAAVDAGMSRERAAAVFGISVPTIERYVRLRRETGSLAPRRAVPPGPAAVKGDAVRAWLPERLKQCPDATLAEHAAACTAETGIEVSPATVYRAIAGLPAGGWTLKKDSERRGARRAGAHAVPRAVGRRGPGAAGLPR